MYILTSHNNSSDSTYSIVLRNYCCNVGIGSSVSHTLALQLLFYISTQGIKQDSTKKLFYKFSPFKS